MENNTIKCPFCFKESQRGVHVCTGCLATVLYGTYPGWYAFAIILLSFGMSFLIGISTGMAGATISLPVIAAGNDSNLLIVFYVQIMPDDFVMQLHRF